MTAQSSTTMYSSLSLYKEPMAFQINWWHDTGRTGLILTATSSGAVYSGTVPSQFFVASKTSTCPTPVTCSWSGGQVVA